MPRRRKLLIQKIASLVVSVLVLSALLAGVAYYQRGIHFEDVNLEAVIRDKLDNSTGPISRSDLLQVTHLDASGQDIVTLKGIEKLTRLVYLNIEDNRVADLSPLQRLSRLSELNLRNNKITCLEEVNFAAITGLPLRSLSLRHNVVRPEEGGQVRLADISLLGELTALEELELRDNHITDISPLSNLDNLRILDLRENRIEDISALENLTELTELNLRENEIEDISALSALTNLTYLNLHSNRAIQSVMPLKKLSNLETLILRNVPVGDEIGVLEGMSGLYRLNLRDTGISDLTVLSGLIKSGALQNDPDAGKEAELNIRGNRLICDDIKTYELITENWGNIAHRTPKDFPRVISGIQPPNFSHQGGFFEDPFILRLTSADPEVKIYYTLDGSEPCPENTAGSVYYYKNDYPTNPGDPFGELLSRSYQTHFYEDPIYITSGGPREVFQVCICTINTTRFSGAFEPPGEVFRGTVIRAVAYKDGYLPSEVVTHSYFVGEGIKDRYHVPVISLVTDESNLFDYDTGIYVAGKTFENWREENPEEEARWTNPANYSQRSYDWERPGFVEIFDGTNILSISQEVGIRISGNSTRNYPNKSLRIYARPEYGQDYFNYPFFGDLDVFQRLILRNAGQDNHWTFMADPLSQISVKEFPVASQEYRPAVLFLNGIYWGLINIRERYDEFYFINKYGIAPEDLVILANERLQHGFPEDVNSYLKLSEIEDTDALFQKVDIESFTYYNIGNLYLTNPYWPAGGSADNICWKKRATVRDGNDAYRSPNDGRWRFAWKDMDKSFFHYDRNMYEQLENRSDSIHFHITKIAWENEEYIVYFLNTLADNINTTFNPKRLNTLIDVIDSKIKAERSLHQKRWEGLRLINNIIDDQIRGYGGKISDPKHFREFADKRQEFFIQHTIDFFNLTGTAEITLINEHEKGKAIINSITIDKNTPGIENPSNWTGIYFKDVPITIKAVPNPGYRFVRWEGQESEEQELTIVLEEDLIVKAVFEEE